MITQLARVAFFLSGVAGLTFEVVWLRYLGLAIGTTTVAVATTTGVYMGGLALGSHLGGRLADRKRRLFALYGTLELSIAAVGLLVPLLTIHISQVDALLLGDAATGTSRALVRLLVAVAVLIVPTTLMGMTLPVLARGVTDSLGQVGRQVGLLYGLNLLGAVLGAGFAGFWWIPAMGLRHTNLVAVGLDAVIGLVAIGAGLRAVRSEPPPLAELRSSRLLQPGGALLVAVLFVTGFAAMALQVMWTRALGTALGPSTYAFAAIVCAYLLGLAGGGLVASQLADRIMRVRLALALVLMVTAAAVLVGIAWVDDLPALLHGVVLDDALTMGGLVRSEFGLAALSLLPATFAMGIIFPLTVSAVVGSEARLGTAVGFAYAANTAGNIVGALAAPFILLPIFGVEWSMRVAALLYLVAAALLLWRVEPTTTASSRRIAVGFGVALALATLIVPSWDVGQWTAGLYRISLARGYYQDGTYEPSEIIFHRDGLAATVTVEEESGVRWIKVDGKIDGSSSGDMPTQMLSGALPMLLRPSAEQVAVIGCGSGVTVGTVLATPAKRVTLVEIEPAMIEGSHLFGEVNSRYWENPRARIVIDDGRNFMRRGGSRFDVIISEPSNPWMSGASSLFTREFFTIAKDRLAAGGLFVQWLQIYELAPARINAILKTFHAVFPHVLVFTPERDSTDLLLVGTEDALAIDPEATAAQFARLAPTLSEINLTSPESLSALLLIDETRIDAVDDTELNTDDNALIEFGAPRDLLAFAERDPDLPLLAMKRSERMALINRTFAPEQPASERAAAMAPAYLALGMLEEARTAAEQALADKGFATPERTAQLEEVHTLSTLLAEEDRVPVIDTAAIRVDPDYARVAAYIAADDDERALALFDDSATLRKKGGLHALAHGYLLYRTEDADAADVAFRRAGETLSTGPLAASIAYYRARNAFSDGEYAEALEHMRTYVNLCGPSLSRCRPAD